MRDVLHFFHSPTGEILLSCLALPVSMLKGVGPGPPKQTVVMQGSSVFGVSQSSEAERERVKPPERNERVCAEIPTPAPINSRVKKNIWIDTP
jgi:hypothetical protein